MKLLDSNLSSEAGYPDRGFSKHMIKKKNSMTSVHKRTMPTEQPPLVSVVPTFADRGCHVVSVMNPYGRILGFLDQSRYYFFQVPPQLYSQG
jgi:CBS-domain-containing membrane protein